MSGSKTMMKRIEQYKDRWSSLGLNTGIRFLSDKLTPAELRKYEIFAPYTDGFLEKISPDVSVAIWQEGTMLFEEGTYIDLAFFVVKGSVGITLSGMANNTTAKPIFQTGITEAPPVEGDGQGTMILDMVALSKQVSSKAGHKKIPFLASMDVDLPKQTGVALGPGELFGEIGSLSGWPQSATARTATECELVQIRTPALRLMKNQSKDLKDRLDKRYRERSLFFQLKSTPLLSGQDDSFIAELADEVDLISLEPDQTVVREGEPVDALYLVRSGFIKLVRRLGKGDLVISYLSKGMTLGEVEILADTPQWESTAISVEYAELVKIPESEIRELVAGHPEVEEQLWQSASARIKERGIAKRDLGHSEFLQTALDRGLVQGTSILGIDLDQCTRCDDCVRACASTHGGRPRFVREGGKLEKMMVPRSCYHCRDPVCLVGCPTGAIHRAGVREVVTIDGEICIGCATCASNCPYDAIVMHDMGETWPEDMVPIGLRGLPRAQASKCDLCFDKGHEPACVTNCPQGCASRVNAVDAFEMAFTKRDEPLRKNKTNAKRTRTLWVRGLVLAVVGILAVYLLQSLLNLGQTKVWHLGYGYAATVLMVIVALYAVRRRFMRTASRLRLGRTRTWLLVHIYGGVLFQLLVWMHAGFSFPDGLLNWWLWALSLWTVITGLIGVAIQRWIPRVLSSGLANEALYERIPALVGNLRARAEAVSAECDEQVRTFYKRTVASYMAEPKHRWRYYLDIGSIRIFTKRFDYLRGFLSEDQKAKVDELEKLLESKLELDAQYTLQRLTRWWLYAHVPPAVLLIVLVAIHVAAVFYY